MKKPNGETMNEIDFILTNRLNTVNNVAELDKFKSSGHRIGRCKATLQYNCQANLRPQHAKL